MKLSIITATYNSAATVADTLRSVAEQSYPDVEHLLIDGCSDDETLTIAAGFPHLAKIISEKDEGIYDAMNKGIRQATGEVIGILNSDDVYMDGEVLSRVMDAFADPEVDAVYGDLLYVRADDLNKVTRTWRSGAFSPRKFYFGWMPPHPTFFVRRSVYGRAGLFNCALRSSADYEFMLRTLLKYRVRVRYIPQFLVRMRTGGMSNASFRHRLRANREDRQAWAINGLKPWFFTIPFKPARKIWQFLIR